jgi:competence CoiA-like predicted nuclease
MGNKNRAINVAIHKETGKILRVGELFSCTKSAFEYRKLYHEKKFSCECVECGQDLKLSGSKNDTIHLKHGPNHEPCFLSQSTLNLEMQEDYERALVAKESPRHKELKLKIGERLADVEGVAIESISIDNKFIIKGEDRRKPDVYCIYKGKELVFEIQLSDLSLGYILSRHNFYKDHGIYLIWILDSYDIKNQGTKEKDLKYLSDHQNFFKLDESVPGFKLTCEYKSPFLTDDNFLISPWKKKLISLSQLEFDADIYQVYYFDYTGKLKVAEKNQRKRAVIIQVDQQRRQIEQLEFEAYSKVTGIISQIREIKKSGLPDYRNVKSELEKLNTLEVRLLNQHLAVKQSERFRIPPIIRWIDEAKVSDSQFLSFILESRQIEFEVNVKDNDGNTLFVKILKELDRGLNDILIKLFLRGYLLNHDDKRILLGGAFGRIFHKDSIVYDLCNRLDNRELVYDAFKYQNLLLIFESINLGKVVGFQFGEDNWLSFANNAIEYYPKHWMRVEQALKRGNVWEKIIANDKKGTFSRKLSVWIDKSPDQDDEALPVLWDLFPYLSL